jgi:hypothetical protein
LLLFARLQKTTPSLGPPSAISMDGKLLTEPEDVAWAFQQAFFKREDPSTKAQPHAGRQHSFLFAWPCTSGNSLRTSYCAEHAEKGARSGHAPDIVQVRPISFMTRSARSLARSSKILGFQTPGELRVLQSYRSPDSFHPVGILPIINKLLERVILNRLKWFAMVQPVPAWLQRREID